MAMKGLSARWTVSMHGTRHEFLAGTRFAGDQHSGARLTQAADRTKDLLHRGRLAKDFRHQSDFVRRTTLVQTLADRSPNQFQCLIDIEGFRQILEGAALKRRHGALKVGIGGHDDDRHCRKAFLEELQQFEPRLTRHADVRNQHLRLLRAGIEPRQRLCCRSEAAETGFSRAPGSSREPNGLICRRQRSRPLSSIPRHAWLLSSGLFKQETCQACSAERQADREAGVARPTLAVDRPLVLLDEALCESQTEATAAFATGHQWIEHALADVLGESPVRHRSRAPREPADSAACTASSDALRVYAT
jgi:hypothetical protein